MPKTHVLPKKIFVQNAEFDEGEPFLIAHTDPVEAAKADTGFREPGMLVGIYVLASAVSVKLEESAKVTSVTPDLQPVSNTSAAIRYDEVHESPDSADDGDDEDDLDDDSTPLEADDGPPGRPTGAAKEIPQNGPFEPNGHVRRRFTDHFNDLFPNLRSIVVR